MAQVEPSQVKPTLALDATRIKVPIYHDWLFRSLLKAPFYHNFDRFCGRWKKLIFLISVALYCHGFGKIVVDGHLVRGRCHFFDFVSDF
jgi:hypothetical protein